MAADGRDIDRVRPKILELLIARGADYTMVLPSKGANCLFHAAGTGHAEAVYALLATRFFDPQATNPQSGSAC